MIRFCDKDVLCVEYGRISRSELLRYFLDGNLDEIVCVLDADGKYFGHITYQALIKNKETEQAILKDCLVLDKDIWRNGRLLFAIYHAQFAGNILLPVIDKDQQLLCFAYEDQDANRNLRMLRELQEKSNAFQFKDIYPEYMCVKIYEFNELAYFFAKYLSLQKIPVQVEGSMWEGFAKSDDGEYLDYSCMKIYAEGVWKKPSNWMENLLRSVSVEFECIDHIYEENIKAGIIKNADKDSIQFLEYLRDSDQVVILGTDMVALDAYDYFKKKGIEICCFASDKYDDRGRILFGKKVLKIIDVMAEYSQPIFVSPYEKGSAWGMGETDWFEYMGYGRNKNFFLLKDYMEIQSDGLKTVLEGRKIILAGDIWLCEKLANYLGENGLGSFEQLKYILLTDKETVLKDTNLKTIRAENIKKESPICLIAFAEENYTLNFKKTLQERKMSIMSSLRLYGIHDYTDYFSCMEVWVSIEGEAKEKYKLASLMPKRILLGSINACSGNTLFRGLLDGHPSIMMIDYNYLNTNLFWFCLRFAGRSSNEIPDLFLKVYRLEWNGSELENIELFLNRLGRLLDQKDTFTSQELFVIFHMAYINMYETDIVDAEKMIIYWEPHHVRRDILEDCVRWLGTEVMPCDIVNVVRNLYMRNGSILKGILESNWPGREDICNIAIKDDDFKRKVYKNSKRYVLRFEDIKCKPVEEFRNLCEEWDISWSESFMHTTVHGKTYVYQNGENQIKDFDLRPVYHAYEEYLSEFDRFRIALIDMLWQEKYRYPYVDLSTFSRKELQEMFLKKFRFENRLSFDSERTYLLFRIKFQKVVRRKLQEIRMQKQKNR